MADFLTTYAQLQPEKLAVVMAIALGLGQSVVPRRGFDVEDWLRLVETYRCTSTFAAPTPKTGSGKLLERELRAPFWAGQTSKVWRGGAAKSARVAACAPGS